MRILIKDTKNSDDYCENESFEKFMNSLTCLP